MRHAHLSEADNGDVYLAFGAHGYSTLQLSKDPGQTRRSDDMANFVGKPQPERNRVLVMGTIKLN
jgi:hypothetical protein